ncbi:MAG: NAD metabolism ATPase/kinase [Bacteroidetes bacterium RBG_13_46_8]|nr:MAG: NAD metabolism ATPase/kinase [Bacteroidetes bacterium RBG_13_46_8]
MFRDRDIQQIKKRGMDIAEAEKQIALLKQTFPFMKLVKAASVGHGITPLTSRQIKEFSEVYAGAQHIEVLKFVPASGAATRMFKALFEFDESFMQANFDSKTLTKEAYKHVKEFFDRIVEFAFYDDLNAVLKKGGKTIAGLLQRKEYHRILDALLNDKGLNYGNLPKGLLKFHKYGKHCRTAVEEHMAEGAGYAKNRNGIVRIHLTVSPEHQKGFETLIKKVVKDYETAYHAKYDITFSVQKPSTDTVAIDVNNEPFRENDGSLHFRPGGHGALLENLNDLTGDILFIKNIDNVVPDHKKQDTIEYKKALAGMMLTVRKKIFKYLTLLEPGSKTDEKTIREIMDFVSEDLCTIIKPKLQAQTENMRQLLFTKLNRPIRICGMVKNEGESGGGPFWAVNPDGSVSLQIVETSQIDHHDPEQEAILLSSSHFNPVDLICSTKDYKGKKFNLHKYRDPNTGFISKKFKNGKPLKALELPGLWNGSMSDWITIFVEVPVTTFNPVKTVSDLLRPEHLGKK